MKNKKRITIFGCGQLGTALAENLRSCEEYALTATVRYPERAAELSAQIGIDVVTDNRSAARSTDVAILAARPQDMEALLAEVGPWLPDGAICVSIAAGLSIGFFRRRLREDVAVVRALPTLLVHVGRGWIALAYPDDATEETRGETARLFRRLSTAVVVVADRSVDRFAAMHGSAAALLLLAIDALQTVGEISADVEVPTRHLVEEMVVGVAAWLEASDLTARDLAETITTPGGMTAAAVREWEKNSVGERIHTAMSSALARALEMELAGSDTGIDTEEDEP